MGRIKGIKNKKSEQRLILSTLSSDERIRFLANIIVDKILEDQNKDKKILQTITKR